MSGGLFVIGGEQDDPVCSTMLVMTRVINDDSDNGEGAYWQEKLKLGSRRCRPGRCLCRSTEFAQVKRIIETSPSSAP